MSRFVRTVGISTVLVVSAYGCGARSSLDEGKRKASSVTSTATGGGEGGSLGQGGEGGVGGQGGEGGSLLCEPGLVRPCGTDVGECASGKQVCVGGTWGPCEGSVEPAVELCNGVDDDCDGETDEGFALGSACDGPDSDLCVDDVVTCGGCTAGPNNVETCNGKDDNCNGTIDSDCDTGDCKPSLLVTGSTPSNPNCVDFPVEKGATGIIQYPCGGGMVTAQLGSLSFSGTVVDGVVALTATGTYDGIDGCTWQTSHSIKGTLPDGSLAYFYSEKPIGGMNCWQACTESGTVQVNW